MQERKASVTAELLWSATKTVRYELKDPRDNFGKAQQHLQNGGSLLMYVNHFSAFDTVVMGRVVSEVGVPMENVTVIVGRSQLERETSDSLGYASTLIHKMQSSRGFNIIPMIQIHDRKRYKDPDRFNLASLRKGVATLKKNGQILALSPEGTRSKTGALLKAQDGTELLLKYAGENTLAFPIGLSPYKILPFITKTSVEAGEPYSYKDLVAEQKLNPDKSITDLIMIRLAKLLPEQNRGYYGQM